MPDETVRVRYIVAVEVGGVRHSADSYEADVSRADADALVASGRALKLSSERAASGAPSVTSASQGGKPADHQL